MAEPPMEGMHGGEVGDTPTAEQLLSVLDQLEGLSEAEREELRQSLLSGRLPTDAIEEELSSAVTSQAMVLFSMLAIVALIIVFFGYKLYKSLKDKERKRDEKKKMKQQKKKK